MNKRLKTFKAMCNQLHKDNTALKKRKRTEGKSEHMSTKAKTFAMTLDQLLEADEDELLN